ncbi:hypothetical protein Tco_0877398 [Tanacetum coccineum]|uniref:Retrotransposon gag domain-containing protein n=1 Tax=Tanacetum coccineum TaxID=301880 RepID=A0ABQ5BXX7_9ASTR
MAEPNNYITATRKNFVSNDNEGRMNAFKHIDKFFKIVGLIKINGLTQDRFRLTVFLVSLAGAASEWFIKKCLASITTWDNMVEKFILKFHHLSDHDEEEETEEDNNPNETDNVPKIFKIEGNMFDFETPLLYDELVDGKLKEETIALKAKIKGSWGDATPGVMKFCKWLKDSFENFHEIDYNVLVKLQECWWKVNAHEIAPFTQILKASYVGDLKENQGHEEQNGNPNPEPSNCKIRRFEMMKYSFDNDEDYSTIKESEYLNHSKDSLDAY